MSGAQAPSPAPAVATYKLKPLTLPDGRRLPIVLQAANGPCPLLAIANVLLLRGQIALPVNAPDISEVVMHAVISK
jgi:ubiquitin carboxyl-terminal hydrolase MINDY-1/2